MRKNNTTNKSTSTTTGVSKDKILASSIQERIVALLSKKGGEWTGSMTELTTALRRIGTSIKADLPNSPSVMRKVVNKAVYSLRRSGVKVNFTRTTDHMRKRVVEFVQR